MRNKTKTHMRQGGMMNKNALVLVLLSFLINTAPTLAQTSPHANLPADPYLQVSKFTTKLISVEETLIPSNDELRNDESTPSLPSLLLEGMDPMAIIDVAFKIWDIIKDGAPVVNVQYKNVKALPGIAERRWEALTGWKAERTLSFGVSTENAYGMKTVDLEYKVKLLFGGGVRGKGQYIASARVVPSKVDVMWGYNLDVSVEVPTILNIASMEDPLALIDLDVTYKISTILRSYSESNSYQLRGDGQMMADGNVVYAASSR